MNKIKVERKEGNTWKSVKVKANVSRNGNMYAKYHREVDGEIKEVVLVWKSFEEGTPVLENRYSYVSMANHVVAGWVKVGRITKYGEVFLGEGESYSEYAHSPEGVEASRKIMEGWRKERFGEQKPVKRFEYPDLLNGGDSQ